jgi:hypothetical protein
VGPSSEVVQALRQPRMSLVVVGHTGPQAIRLCCSAAQFSEAVRTQAQLHTRVARGLQLLEFGGREVQQVLLTQVHGARTGGERELPVVVDHQRGADCSAPVR